MSYHDEINRLLGKELFALPPLIQSQPSGRAMFISREINAIAHPPWKPNQKGIRFARMRAQLDRFTEGQKISVSENPASHPGYTFMARNDPMVSQAFDIRCTDPRPGIRVFGRFIEKDTFVGLTWDYRENLNGKDFDAAVERLVREWRRLFPNEPLFAGRNLNEYVTNFYLV
jgi:hypothetical protein